MEKIIVISSDRDRSMSLYKLLELIFPECLIETMPDNKANDSGILIPESVGWGE